MTRGDTALAPVAEATLCTRSVPLPADVDPLLLWRACPDPQRFFWERSAEGEALAGVGATLTLRGDGAERFATIRAAQRALAAPADAVLLGGFAFDPRHTGSGAWRGFPSAEWVVPRLALVRRRGRATLVASELAVPGTRPPALAAELDAIRTALARLQASGTVSVPAHYRVAATTSPQAWRRAVEATCADIAAGRLAKLVLARTCLVEAGQVLDPVRVLARLRRSHPGCTTFAVGRGPATFLGATPERLARVERGMVRTAALAGTAPRGTSAADDRALARTLRASPKEAGEHRLVVDDLRTRLQPMCTSLAVAPAPRLLRTEAVQHLCTPLAGPLRPGVGLLDVVERLHPTPAVCGAPRAAALAALAGRERLVRGWYAGGVGWLRGDDGEVAVALRTALVHGGRALLHAGCGIVAGSEWEAELEETRWKLRPLLSALLEV